MCMFGHCMWMCVPAETRALWFPSVRFVDHCEPKAVPRNWTEIQSDSRMHLSPRTPLSTIKRIFKANLKKRKKYKTNWAHDWYNFINYSEMSKMCANWGSTLGIIMGIQWWGASENSEERSLHSLQTCIKNVQK